MLKHCKISQSASNQSLKFCRSAQFFAAAVYMLGTSVNPLKYCLSIQFLSKHNLQFYQSVNILLKCTHPYHHLTSPISNLFQFHHQLHQLATSSTSTMDNKCLVTGCPAFLGPHSIKGLFCTINIYSLLLLSTKIYINFT